MERMLKKSLLFAMVLLSFFPLAGASLTVERTIDRAVESDGTVEVLLKLKLWDANVDSVIITEQLPAGWELVEASPTASDFGNGKFKWLVYDSPMRDKTLSYTLKAPLDFSEPAIVLGEWRTLEEMGLVEGDALLQPKPVEPEQPPAQPQQPVLPQPSADYSLIIMAGVVLIVLAIIAAALILRKKPEPKSKKQ